MIWIKSDGKIISCVEKLKILNENIEELGNLKLPYAELLMTREFQDALDDAILIGVSAKSFQDNVKNLLDN